jgi:hypothetical protein
MPFVRRLGLGVLLCWFCSAALAQQPVPLADKVDEPLLPTGISELPITLDAELVYLFKDDDGTDVVHLVGGASVSVGQGEGPTLRAGEAVVWISPRMFEGRPYHHFEILLWVDAEVREVAGTVTKSPALFVTLNSSGTITTQADDTAFQPSADTQAYQEGTKIREALRRVGLPGTEDRVALRVLDATGLRAKPRAERPAFDFRARGDFSTEEVDGRRMMTFTGGVLVSQGKPGEQDFVEIRADSAVLILSDEGRRGRENGSPRSAPGMGGLPGGRPRADERRRDRPASPFIGQEPPQGQRVRTGFGEVRAEAVYLEGDVLLAQGQNTIRASRIYYDWTSDRAIILDAVVRTVVPDRNIPLYVRAAEIRQLSAQQFAAEDAILTTSEFHTPHYHVGARKILVTNRTPGKPTGEATGLRAGSFRINDATLNIAGVPIGYWPFVMGGVDIGATSMKSMRLGYSGDFGAEIESEWHFFNLAGLERPEGFDATLKLDYFSERGPAAGLNVDYERDEYYGLARSYLINESGKDSLGRDREEPTKSGARGRLLMRHREFLEEDWQFTFELSYICDRNFLEEYFEKEFDTDKEQETLLYVKKQRESWAFTGLLQWRVLDWLTQTESLPDFSLHWMGPAPVGTGALYSENRLGAVRYRPGEQTFREFLRNGQRESSGTSYRADSRQEIEQPIDFGPVRIVPYVSVRGTVWQETRELGGETRIFGSYGLRGSMYLWKVYPDVESEILDIHGLRHIVKADLIAFGSHTNADSNQLYPFNELIEGIDEYDGFAMGVRQRFQTKRGQGETYRTTDVLTLDLGCGFFSDTEGGERSNAFSSVYTLFKEPAEQFTNGFTSLTRPENSIARNYISSAVIWRINDRTALASEANYDVNDGTMDVLNVSVVMDRSPRLTYLLGYRYLGDIDSNLLGFDASYKLNEKHTLALRELFDLDRGRTHDFTIGLVRKLPRWYAAVAFQIDEAKDDIGVSFSLWPEGLPSAVLGSKRFTGLAGGARLRQE